MADIKFNCPYCQQPMAGDPALVTETVECPECRGSFRPGDAEKMAAANVEREFLLKKIDKDRQTDPKEVFRMRLFDIRARAICFTGGSLLFCVLAIVSLGTVLVDNIGQDDTTTAWICCGSFLVIASWLYLIAQVIYIRANTEK